MKTRKVRYKSHSINHLPFGFSSPDQSEESRPDTFPLQAVKLIILNSCELIGLVS